MFGVLVLTYFAVQYFLSFYVCVCFFWSLCLYFFKEAHRIWGSRWKDKGDVERVEKYPQNISLYCCGKNQLEKIKDLGFRFRLDELILTTSRMAVLESVQNIEQK